MSSSPWGWSSHGRLHRERPQPVRRIDPACVGEPGVLAPGRPLTTMEVAGGRVRPERPVADPLEREESVVSSEALAEERCGGRYETVVVARDVGQEVI